MEYDALTKMTYTLTSDVVKMLNVSPNYTYTDRWQNRDKRIRFQKGIIGELKNASTNIGCIMI